MATIEEQLRASNDPDFWTSTFFKHRTTAELSSPEMFRHWFKEAIEVGQRHPGGLRPEQVQAAMVEAFGAGYEAMSGEPVTDADYAAAEPAMKRLMSVITGRPLAAPEAAPVFDQDAP